MKRLPNFWLILFIIFSIIGLFSSLIVLYTFYYLHIAPPLCFSSQIFPGVTVNCIKVLTSQYSHIFGIPLDVIAAIWFIINVIFVFIYSYTKNDNLANLSLKFLFYWRFIGILIVPYLIYIEIFVLNALCIYCTIMHSTIILDFIVISIYFYKRR